MRLITKQLVTWTEQEVSKFARSLGANDSGTPSATARLRLAFLGKIADRCWRDEQQPFRLRRRLFKGFLNDDPRASPLGITARSLVQQWQAMYAACERALQGRERTPLEAGTLAALSLALNSRVSDKRLLQDAVTGNLRSIRRGGLCYVEWTPDGVWPDHAHGVIRYCVSPECAANVDALRRAKKLHHSALSLAPRLLRPLLDDLGLDVPCSIDALLDTIWPTVEALNYLDLPGNVAAARSGRFLSAALSWPDWTRGPDGSFATIDPPKSEQIASDGGPRSGSLGVDPLSAIGSAVGLDSRKAAAAFNAEMRAAMSMYRVGGVDARLDATQRREMARAVAAARRKHETRVSSSMSMIGRWTESLFDKRQQIGLLRASSIRRYFGALSRRFESVAHDVDLAHLDSDGLTRLFAAVLEVRNVDKPSYIFQRLREFHKFCTVPFRIATPDWSELGVEDVGIGISPGFLEESAYARLFESLGRISSVDMARKTRLMALLSYRFGLRPAEVALLRVKDVVDAKPVLYVVIERTDARDVKSEHGRRTVPLTFLLSSEERAFLQIVLAQARERARTHPEALLLADPGMSDAIVNKDAVAREVSSALKSVTGNKVLTEHHLRHSYACHIWTALETPDDQLPDQCH